MGGVYAPFRSAEYSGVFSTAHSFQVIGDMSTDIAVCCWVNDSWIPLTTHNWTRIILIRLSIIRIMPNIWVQ